MDKLFENKIIKKSFLYGGGALCVLALAGLGLIMGNQNLRNNLKTKWTMATSGPGQDYGHTYVPNKSVIYPIIADANDLFAISGKGPRADFLYKEKTAGQMTIALERKLAEEREMRLSLAKRLEQATLSRKELLSDLEQKKAHIRTLKLEADEKLTIARKLMEDAEKQSEDNKDQLAKIKPLEEERKRSLAEAAEKATQLANLQKAYEEELDVLRQKNKKLELARANQVTSTQSIKEKSKAKLPSPSLKPSIKNKNGQDGKDLANKAPSMSLKPGKEKQLASNQPIDKSRLEVPYPFPKRSISKNTVGSNDRMASKAHSPKIPLVAAAKITNNEMVVGRLRDRALGRQAKASIVDPKHVQNLVPETVSAPKLKKSLTHVEEKQTTKEIKIASLPKPSRKKPPLKMTMANYSNGKLSRYSARRYHASNRELHCMATAIYFEARSESVRGQIAVGQVIMNRVKSKYYPGTICGVVYEGAHRRNSCQFSFACDGKSDYARSRKHWHLAMKLGKKIVNGQSWLPEVNYSSHYHATYVRPRWRRNMYRQTRIGTHIFYRAKFLDLAALRRR